MRNMRSLRRSRVILRRNRNISPNLDIQRMQLITQKSTHSRPSFHLDILQIRRARTRLGQEIRVTDIRIDIVRAIAPIRPILQLERREQTANYRETGAYQADRGLNVCPEGCLVDRISGISGANPEQHDDAVYASEAHEKAQCEHAVQRELILPCTMKIPDHRDWQDEDDKVHEDIEGLVDDEEEVCVEAVALDAVVPVCA